MYLHQLDQDEDDIENDFIHDNGDSEDEGELAEIVQEEESEVSVEFEPSPERYFISEK